ncbi:MAG: acetate kinase [Ignavibacteriales bacterium]|nr:MAG: acetate kinase [Ignavibacteriaceae bacterium]MBW7874271.1 acetate kinase [Ignavibacteria bacterium]MCZ2142685.1 acetate kinase [Ignavibacteriales bacterium]MBV6443783.1 Acetate kinase [Ignavibacteriaceae bacterium]MBZ0196378.1 acetate kinase [Ignavibacteriaceae bacterium]
MKVLVLNCGSSSIKYQFYDTVQRVALAKGLVDRIGMLGAVLTHTRFDGDKISIVGEILDHAIGIEYVLAVLLSKNHGVIEDKSEIDAVGHRVVHGGETFTGSVLISPEVVKVLQDNVGLAPLHNPPNIKGIQAVTRVLPDVPQVGVFDTAFHSKMPPKAYLYGIPFELYKMHQIRRYGFHGTSHRYVGGIAAKKLGKPLNELKIVTAHLGNGCSMAAIDQGVSVDTTMGFTPLEGLLMGTRCGDIDTSVILHVMGKEGLQLSEANTLLNKHSGLIGISGESSDMREIISSMKEGHKRSRYAFEIFCYRITKYIGAYAAAMGGIDALVFTGGIGENSPDVREEVCRNLAFMGINLNNDKNLAGEEEISSDDSRVYVFRIPTNEELVIALDTEVIVSGKEVEI